MRNRVRGDTKEMDIALGDRMSGARETTPVGGIESVSEIGIGTEIETETGSETGIGIEETIVGEMTETEIVIEIEIGIERGRGREIEKEKGIDVGTNRLAVALLHLIDVARLRIHLATINLHRAGHQLQRPKRRNRD